MHQPCLRVTRTLAAALTGAALGCGGSTTIGATGNASAADGASGVEGAPDGVALSSDGAALDGGGPDGDVFSTDGGGFPCGDALCEPPEICLYPAYGCVGVPRNDAGNCPSGTEPVGDASNICLPPAPSPSCVSPTPGDQYDCDGPNTVQDCSFVSAPIPSACSRTCRENCV
jgi:hypothetical protein